MLRAESTSYHKMNRNIFKEVSPTFECVAARCRSHNYSFHRIITHVRNVSKFTGFKLSCKEPLKMLILTFIRKFRGTLESNENINLRRWWKTRYSLLSFLFAATYTTKLNQFLEEVNKREMYWTVYNSLKSSRAAPL